MLNKELSRIAYNKTSHRNNIIKLLKNRSNGSIEFKHQNISAVLIKLGLPFIKGYKPLYNYQLALEERLIDYLKIQKHLLEPRFVQFAEETPMSASNYNFKNILDVPPEKRIIKDSPVAYERKPIKINYLQREQNNMTLGEQGEALVIEYEKWKLVQSGKENYADKVEWISKADDGAGFDILSRNENGTDKYIEVKTTKLSKDTPIFFSKNEYEFSQVKINDYHLYRVFNFSNDPKIFLLNGEFDSFCRKEAIQYKGYF